MTLKNAGLGRSVRMVLVNQLFTFERSDEATVVTLFSQERKDVANAFAEHGFATETGDTLHGPIPGNDLAVAIEREDTVDARVDQPVKQKCRSVVQSQSHGMGINRWSTFQP